MATDAQTMTEPGLAVPRLGPGSMSIRSSGMARGACPSLAAPMQTGDGLLVRLRPSSAGLTISAFRRLAAAAGRHGNGLIEITARGNLQLRGLTMAVMPELEADIALAGIVPETGLAIETPPLSGRDPAEIADARAMAARLRQALAALPAPLALAPKLSIIVDGGGNLTLEDVSADIRLMAVAIADTRPQWLIAVAGTRASATALSLATDEEVVAKTLGILKALHELGPRARGRDLLAAGSVDRLAIPPMTEAMHAATATVGLHALAPTTTVLGLRPAFGQIHAHALIRFLDLAEAEGVEELRTASDHSLLLLGPAARGLERLQALAGDFGFWTDAANPLIDMAACAGAGACASATYFTKQIATKLAEWAPNLLDGSIRPHLSGCPKGCAHPSASAVTIVGIPGGFGIVLGAKASALPDVVVDEDGLQAAMHRLAALVGQTKDAGESVNDCLTRLGSDAVSAALRQE